jgi:anti-sigma B factor antagonist
MNQPLTSGLGRAHVLLALTRMSPSEPHNVLPLHGEIDLNVSPQLASTFNEMIQAKPPRVVVDLTNVTYIDSSGLAVLIVGMQQVKEYGGKFALAGLQGDVRSILETARLDQFFSTYPHVDAALAAD